ncbi:formyl transferase [Blastopirellula sp. J2-11]|uniref:formyl transferase n=1 Tax=Blastopirellula sp. J2-11 TaxID=2943192 RepID=UPI0021C63E4B|nr:formyl transferase [Blastopirellula sp. J2-11]UUO09189.1 formyl transferase [Blastopirellula sp. J2-11]
MNVVAISTMTPQHRYVLAKLHETCRLRHLIQPVWTSQSTTWKQYAKVLRSPLSFIGRRIQSRYNHWRGVRHFQTVAKLLGPTAAANLSNLEPSIVSIHGFNCEANVALLQDLQPDVIITSGCPILKPEIFGLARLATINIHWGIAPTYRGENTFFWPLYFGDYEQVGVTIHRIDAGIDTGPILAHGFIEVTSEDDEDTLTVKAAQVAARLLPRILTRIEETQTVEGFAPQEKGTLYLGRNRTWRHDLAYWWRRRSQQRNQQIATARDAIYIGKPASGF